MHDTPIHGSRGAVHARVAGGGPVNRPMALLANAGVDAEVEIAVHARAPDDEAISILFGKAQVTLDFYDVASLERLRDVAAEGAQRLRAAIEANARAGAAADGAVAAADRPVELDRTC